MNKVRKSIIGLVLLLTLTAKVCDTSGGNLFFGDGCEKGTSQSFLPDGSVYCKEDREGTS